MDAPERWPHETEEDWYQRRVRRLEKVLGEVVSVLLEARGGEEWPLLNAEHQDRLEKAIK